MHNNSHTHTRKKKRSIKPLLKGALLLVVIAAAASSAIASYYMKRPSEFWERFMSTGCSFGKQRNILTGDQT